MPLRSCVICRTRLPKGQLHRHVCPPGGGVADNGAEDVRPLPDPEQRLPGRGFYICDDAQCRKRGERYQGWRRKCKGVEKL